jgi:antitoxin component YwqK of YwqJK toxin-antitoxin module
MTSSVGWSETMDGLIKRDTIYYKKFTEVPFTGKIDGQEQGSMKNGKREGSWDRRLHSSLSYWVSYWKSGQLWNKGDYKNGKKEGSWVSYYNDGSIWKQFSGTFKNGKKISD